MVTVVWNVTCRAMLRRACLPELEMVKERMGWSSSTLQTGTMMTGVGGSRSSGHLQCAEGLVLEVVLPHSAVRVCSIHVPRTGVGGKAVDPHPLPAGHHTAIQALEVVGTEGTGGEGARQG